jgi:chemotaxis protein MotB
MKPRYWQSGAESHAQNRWMVSYLDVLTILLVFFIGVAARALQPAAVQPPGKPAAVKPAADEPASDEPVPAKAAMNQPVPPLLESPPQPPAAAPVQASAALDRAQQQLAQEGLDLRREQWGLVISLPQAILFPSGEERIQFAALPVVAEIAEVLRRIPNKVNLGGNADSVPIHNRHFHNNWELSAARGMALLDLLASRYGIEEARLSVTSYGSFRPRDSNDTPHGRAGNRRVEITILDESREPGGPPERAP